jgi:SAM-dependent methyltransferase
MKLKSITRIATELDLIPILKSFKINRVLDVGSKESPYKRFINYSEYKRLDLSPSSKPDYVADLHDLDKIPKNYFDIVIATEVLEHLYNPQKAVEEIRKILKKGGICVATTRFFYHFHPDPNDYYRFTWDSLKYIFKHYQKVEVTHQGNWFQTLWQLLDIGKFGIFIKLFNPLVARIKSKKTKYPLGFIVVAKK